ncbi:hypothetical protein ACP4OV_019186 [Aristida adscensionis]
MVGPSSTAANQMLMGRKSSFVHTAPKEFISRGRGSHLKAHRNLRRQQNLNGVQHVQGQQNGPIIVASQPKHQQAIPNTSQQPLPQQQPLALPENSMPVIQVRCCCGITEKIPRTERDLMERATNYDGSWKLLHSDLGHLHQCQPKNPSPPVEIPFLDLAPPEPAVEENSAVRLESGQDIDLTLGL